MLRKSFAIELWADGSASCTEVTTAPPGTMSLLQWRGSIADRLPRLIELLVRVGFESWPERVGAGAYEVELWIRAADGESVHRALRVAFDGDRARIDAEAERWGTSELVELIDEIVEAIRGGSSGAGPESPERAFPSAEDRRARRRSLRFTETHDWDGSTACYRLIDARLSEDGRGELREVDTSGGGYRITSRRRIERSERERAALFASLSAMNLSAVRRSAGGGELDTTYTQRVEYFDGAKLVAFEYVWTRERGLGVSDGGNPPNALERALLELGAALARR